MWLFIEQEQNMPGLSIALGSVDFVENDRFCKTVFLSYEYFEILISITLYVWEKRYNRLL